MASISQSGLVARRLERLFGWGTVSGLSEGQLLARFVSERDESAFEAIVTRHGPMVLGICRRLLDDPGDADDAFQATFLVLVQKARSLRNRELLGNWLYGVAVRVAHRSRRQKARRRGRELDIEIETIAGSDEIDSSGVLHASLDAEVARLPEKFRAPVILCYFEGLTHDEAALRLRCPVGTVRSRMAKARSLLRARLTRAGVGPIQASLGLLHRPLAAEIPPALVARLTHSALRVVAGQSLADAVSTSVASLTEGASRMIFLNKIVALAPAALVASALLAGVGLAARQAGDRPAAASSSSNAAPPKDNLEFVLEHNIILIRQQLAHNKAESEQLKSAEQLLRERLVTLEGELVEVRSRKAAQTDPTASKKQMRSSDGPPASTEPDQAGRSPRPDSVVTTSRLIISQPARSNRLVLYDLATGRAQTYRPPDGHALQNWWIQDQILVIASSGPAETRLAAYVIDRDQWITQDLRETVSNREISGGDLRPVLAGLVRVQLSSPSLSQIAVMDTKQCRWFVQDLREPVKDGHAVPYTEQGLALYVLGRHLYAFSAEAGRWDVLTLERELPRVAFSPPDSPKRWMVDPNFAPVMARSSIAVSESGRLHVFLAKTGRWRAVDAK
jgi:RNA polymerase sigma factor (sigma-70 family)